MPEYALARSPIEPAPPVTELAGWAVSGRRSDAALTIADWTPLAKVLLHAPLGGLGVRYGAAAHQTWGDTAVLLVGWAPDQWLALGPPRTESTLIEQLAPTGGTVVDVTHAGALVRVTGDRARDVLAHECALDLSDRAAPNGSTFRTAICGVAAGLIRDDVDDARSYLAHCEWPLGDYLFESLRGAGNAGTMDIDGLRITQSR